MSLARFAFQACSIDHSDISPFRINNLRTHNDQEFADCDKSSNVPRSLTGLSSIAAPLLPARRNDEPVNPAKLKCCKLQNRPYSGLLGVAARNQKTGLKFTISGPFLLGS
jgi:hypothetical protein